MSKAFIALSPRERIPGELDERFADWHFLFVEKRDRHVFSNREKRIKRREERNLFRYRLMPLAWIIALIGVAGLLVATGTWLIYGTWPYRFAGPFAALTILPFVLMVVSFLRGHHSKRLEEP